MPGSVTASAMLPGWHSWPDAVAPRVYLKHPHRHLFHVTVEVAVTHSDRDIEFHDLGDFIRDWWGDTEDQRDRGSCEKMAEELWFALTALAVNGPWSQPPKVLAVTVGEDGENWATWRP